MLTGVLVCVCSADNVGTDVSPKVVRQTYRKAPAPPPPSSTNQNPSSQQPTPAGKITVNHHRSHSATNEMAGAVLHYERPSVPPPAPPKKMEKPNVGNKADLLTGEKVNQADLNGRSSGHVSDGLKQASPVVFATVGLGVTGDRTNSADFEPGLQTRSADTSGVSDVAELSWSGESDQSQSASQPKEDIRKMTAQLKAQWWHNSPTPGDRAASKMSTEISGTFNQRASPSTPRRDGGLDGKLEKKGSENDVCQEKSGSVVDSESDNSDKMAETMDRKSDTVDADHDDAGDLLKMTDETYEDLDKKRLSTDSVGKPFEEQNGESEKLEVESTVSKNIETASPRTPPTPSPRSSLAVDRDSVPVSTECGSDSLELAAVSSETAAPSTSTLSTPLSESTCSKESLEQPEISPGSPTTPRGAPLTRSKPVRSPPARPPAFITRSDGDGPSEACPPVLPRKTSMDGKPPVPDSVAELPTSPQSDLPPKIKTVERVRPEKPPPPLPKSLRRQASEPANKSQMDVDSSGDVAAGDEVATHDENTHL